MSAATSGQLSRHHPGNPLSAGACRHAGCGKKASRHAVTPQLRPQGIVSLPVASSAPSRVRDELLFNLSVPPASRAGRRHRQNRQRPLTLIKLVRCRSKEITNARASGDVLRVGGQGRAVTACAGSALPLNRKAIRWFAQIRHIV
jgi:hypothetical protein